MTWHITGWVSLLIATIGAVAWGIVGLFSYSPSSSGYEVLGRVQDAMQGVTTSTGSLADLDTGSRIAYTILGVAGVISLGVLVDLLRARLGGGLRILAFVGALIAAVGAINWGLIGLFKYDALAALLGEPFGTLSTTERILAVVVGVAGLVAVVGLVGLFRSYFIDTAARRPLLIPLEGRPGERPERRAA
jgi:uncharacterized membrane protein YuzA (DUF378 family)